MSARRRTVDGVGILQLLDNLPEAVTRSPSQVWWVLTRSLGEQGAAGRTALAWRWALTGECPSPVTLSIAPGRPPGRAQVLAEARADADPGGQVMQARFALEWLAGETGALPLWNAGAGGLRLTDGAPFGRGEAEIDQGFLWALLARHRYRWRPSSAPATERLAFGWARGAVDLLAWTCGETTEGPFSGNRTADRPTLYQVSVDAGLGMAGLLAREAGDLVTAKRTEAVMETFLWLAGWSDQPPADRHGHPAYQYCPERGEPCRCEAAGRCLADACPACRTARCVHAYMREDARSAGYR
jgi:hypothetical protein